MKELPEVMSFLEGKTMGALKVGRSDSLTQQTIICPSPLF